MGFLYSHGITTIDFASDLVNYHPTENQARLVRVKDTFNYYFYIGTSGAGTWKHLNLDFNSTYENFTFSDSSNLHTIIQELIDAIANLVTADGNLHTIVRITDVEPVPGATGPQIPSEIASADLTLGDAAVIYYKKTNGTNWGFYDRWVYKNVGGTPTWVFILTLDFSDYVSEITVTRAIDKNTLTPHTNVGGSDVPGTPTYLLPVTETEAGLMTPQQTIDLADLVENAIMGILDTNTIDLVLSVPNKILSANLKLPTGTGTNAFVLASNSNGVYINSQLLNTYSSHAAATADAALLSGHYYCLTVNNIEGVASNGNGPIFRKV